VAVLVFGANDERLAALWAALGRPCWVSPQLAAVASLSDPAFERNARERIGRRGRLDMQGARAAFSSLTGSPAPSPRNGVVNSPELVSALVRLLERRATVLAEHPAFDLASNIREIIDSDVDGGGGIAERWLAAIEVLVDVPRCGK
jgi:hypothetical protein